MIYYLEAIYLSQPKLRLCGTMCLCAKSSTEAQFFNIPSQHNVTKKNLYKQKLKPTI